MKKSLLMVLCAAFAMSTLPASAVTYISNLSQPNPVAPASFVISVMQENPGGVFYYAQSFTTGDTASAFNLESVVLSMFATTGVEGGGFNLSIYDNNAVAPGSAIGSLTGNVSPAQTQEYTYTASGITLMASTTYWIVASNTGTEPYGWKLADSAATVSGNWNSPLSFLSKQGAGSWAEYPLSEPESLKYSLNASPVPEPTGMVLLLSGAGVLAFVRRCRVARS